MRYLICSRGKPEELEFIPELIQENIGVELQSYGLEGVASDIEWQRRLTMHADFCRQFSGYIAVHGPFIGVCFCHPDHLFRNAVQERLDKTLNVAIELNAKTLVLHSGLSSDVAKFGIMSDWIKDTVKYWKSEIRRYADAGITVVLENIVDESPEFLRIVHDEIDHPNLKLCLDTGHVNVWSTISLEEWLVTLGSRIAHIHLHNNNGRKDQHTQLHEGTLDLMKNLRWIKENLPDVNISLEMIASSGELIEGVRSIRNTLI